jgi:predicted metal-dependent hydrolase
MSSTRGVATYGKETFSYSVHYVPRRTLEIAVHPDKSVVVKAPVGTATEKIEQRVHKRARWITRQRDYFAQFEPRTPKRLYVGGETHLYLGRQYRLRIHAGESEGVKLSRGYFDITIAKGAGPARVKELLDRWYREKAVSKFSESLEKWWPKFAKAGAKPSLHVRKLKKRWGSLSASGRLTLNLDMIRAPQECIDYVVVHELCHLKHADHGAEFYRQLSRVIPDWKKKKLSLERSLA